MIAYNERRGALGIIPNPVRPAFYKIQVEQGLIALIC